MALVVFCGAPLTGKTTQCIALIEKFQKREKHVIHISLDTLSLSPVAAYKDSTQQKNTRSALRSAVERALSNRQAVVLLDALNGIKGFRYEIWCLARAVAAKYSLLYFQTPFETCLARNKALGVYPDELFRDLWSSFEQPEVKNRWDCPLFTVQEGAEDSTLDTVVETVCGDNKVKTTLIPTTATSNPALSETNLQHNIDKAIQTVVDRITELQKEAGSESIGIVRFDQNLPALTLNRFVSIIELRRLKRGFLKVATQGINSKLTDPVSASRLFIEYLEQNL